MRRARSFDRRDPGALRALLVAGAMGIVFATIAGKGALVALQTPAETGGISSAFSETVRRADIIDRNGELLATSVDVYSLFADPRAIWDAKETAAALVKIFPELSQDTIEKRLSNRDRAFAWIKRGLTPRQRDAVFQLGLEGVGFRKESSRAYPRGTLAGHALGYVGNDGEGLGGMEYALEDRLAEGGAPVQLTLDSGVQFMLEAELAGAAAEHDAIGAAGVVMSARTGEIHALASWPPLDPNRAKDIPSTDPARLDRAIGAVYELGSVFKPLTVAAGIETGAILPTDRFDVQKPLTISGFTINDDHPIYGVADVTKIISESSNIGTVKIAERIGSRRQKEFLGRLGLMDRAPIELLASAKPLVPENWTELSNATISYGHGMSVSPLAFTSAFSALANGGEIVPPTLVLSDKRSDPARVMSAPTAAVVTAMLRDAVVNGTGERAEVAGYRVAGKTGTAEKPIPGGYSDTLNVNSFAALFPADSPEYVVLVVLDEPKAGATGGATAAWNAAPTAGRVIERIAPILGVAPKFNETARPTGPNARSVADKRSSL